MYRLHQVKQEGLWLSLKMQRKGWKPEALGLLGGNALKGWFLFDLIRLWLGAERTDKHWSAGRDSREGFLGMAARTLHCSASALPTFKGDTSLKTSVYFSRGKHLLDPDLEKAAFHQHKHHLYVFPSLQSTARSLKMKDATEIPTCHIFIILAVSNSRLKAGNLISLLLLLLSFLRLFWESPRSHVLCTWGCCVHMVSPALCWRNMDVLCSFTVKCLSPYEDFLFLDFYRGFPPTLPTTRIHLPYMKWIVNL